MLSKNPHFSSRLFVETLFLRVLISVVLLTEESFSCCRRSGESEKEAVPNGGEVHFNVRRTQTRVRLAVTVIWILLWSAGAEMFSFLFFFRIQKTSSMLSIKEDSLRRLKEDLRRAQQRGEESFLQGEDLHAKLTNPKGLVVRSSILLEKTKLEEEVKQLQLKITGLESLVSSQQAEVAKWKNRAIKLKNKTEMDEPPLPSTTSKRPPPMTADFNTLLCSPKKILLTSNKMLASPLKGPESPSKPLDSPKSSLFRSPKSRFFDAGGASEVLSRNRPKQFFDNSALGTTPDAAAGASGTDPWWPLSPKKEDFCKTQ
uniref:Uncharacterized protein n=1 Tax=Oryzias latipes TaxID=8090 RepID=A0A3P9I0X2_ORYLA